MVEPLTIGALIFGIISAYSNARTYLITRQNRKDAKRRRQLKQLEKSVSKAPPDIQTEYDRNLSRLGSRFDAGDSIGRNQLQEILIQLQSSMIRTLQSMLAGADVDIPSILDLSDRSRCGSISALSEQFQRLNTATPIPNAVPSSTTQLVHRPSPNLRTAPNFCPGAVALQQDDNLLLPLDDLWYCGYCKTLMSPWKGFVQDSLRWSKALRGLHRAFSHASHARKSSGPVLRYCRICWEIGNIISPPMRIDKWLLHLRNHIASGQFELCRSQSGIQQRRARCGDASCKKIHGGVI